MSDYFHCCPVCGHKPVKYYYNNTLIECGSCGWSMDLSTPEPKKKESMSVLYVCNKGRCTNCTWPVCQHTTDIKYAANFVNENGYWKEKVKDDGE